MLTFFFAFFLSFNPSHAFHVPSPTDSFVTPMSLAFSDVQLDLASAVPVALPIPIPIPIPTVVAAITAPAKELPVATKPSPTTVAPAPAASTPSIFGAGGILNPDRLGKATLAQSGRLSANQVVDKVQDFYKDTKQLTAKFRQTVKNATFGKETTSDGWVFIKKPGKMRWDYYSKKKKTQVSKSFISDGTSIWAVYHQDLQYYKKKVEDDLMPVAITFLSGTGDLKTDFDAELDTKAGYGKKGDYVIKLTPKKPNAQYSNLWLVVDSSTYRVKQSIVLNAKGDTNQFAFHKGDTKKTIKDSTFAFNEKANKKFRLINPEKAPKK